MTPRLLYYIQLVSVCMSYMFLQQHYSAVYPYARNYCHDVHRYSSLATLGAVVAASRIFGSSAVFIFLAVLLPFNILNLYQSSRLYPAASS